MNTLANSLVIAIRHIESHSSNDPDVDLSALEEIAFLLQRASEEEICAFASAAKEQGVSELLDQLGVANA